MNAKNGSNAVTHGSWQWVTFCMCVYVGGWLFVCLNACKSAATNQRKNKCGLNDFDGRK